MNNINDIYKSNSDNLKAEDLGNQMYTMTIASADLVTFDAGDSKVVLSFQEDQRKLPLNKTNATAISEMYGPDWSMWQNRQITLFSMPVDFQGKTVQGIRIRPPQAQQQPAQGGIGGGQQTIGHAVHQPLQKQPQGQQQYDERNPPPLTENPYENSSGGR